MKTKVLWLNDQLSDFASYQSYAADSNEKKQRVKRMEKLLHAAMANELTVRQKLCIELYYFKKKNVTEIAALLHIRPTTVYKHLKAGRNALKRCVPYL